jgi:serine/threonine protein phosphatase PrpC
MIEAAEVDAMNEAKKYIESLLTQKNYKLNGPYVALFEKFVKEEENVEGVRAIKEIQNKIMESWKVKTRVNDILNAQLMIPNATVGKPYEAKLDFIKMGLNDLIYSDFSGLEEHGLQYDNMSESITGTPLQGGDFKVYLHFRVEGESENSELNQKPVNLVVNADPKSLWKNIPSTKQHGNYWKPDNVEDFQPLGDKHIVVASKRGRSHGNVGSFRDDDFAFRHFETSGWSVVSMSDGAGSAIVSRKGSQLACEAVIEYMAENITVESTQEFDAILQEHHVAPTEVTQKKISFFIYNNVSKAALAAHKKIEEFADTEERPIKDFHSTLIFAMFKKYDFGYVLLSFGVGDCPIGLLNKDMTEIKLMNWLDVGEFGGGTRFITMPEIFSNEKFPTRLGFKIIPDFSYLMLMTDGIYDPKFIVEANLEKIEKWQEFLSDLGGNNEEKITVEFRPDNAEIANQLSAWMDFWSPGNHDDRTLAIIF